MFKAMYNKFCRNRFVHNVSVLAGASAFGQAIAIIILPFLTRLYDPDDFSVLAVYVSVLTLLSITSGLCFELAIPIPKIRGIAAALLVMSVVSVIFYTVLTVLVVVFIPELFGFFTNNKIEQFLWLLPLGVFAIGLYNSLQYWSMRNKDFVLISKTRINQALSGNFIKLVAGFFSTSWGGGLIVGQLVAQGSGSLSFILSLLKNKNDIEVFKKLKLKHFKLAFERYQKFPKFTTLELFLNSAGIQIPIIFIAYYAIGSEVGYLMIAIQLLSAPMGMISGAVAQAYLADAADKHHQGQLPSFTRKIILNLFKISIIPICLILLCAPLLIPYVLGESWARTGILISWMAPWFLMQFITSPVSTSLYITNNQKLAFLLQLVGLILRVGCVWLAGVFVNQYIAEFYAVSGFVFYLVYLLVVLKVLKNIELKEGVCNES